MTIAPPPGFVLDAQPQTSAPPPPKGFVLDGSPASAPKAAEPEGRGVIGAITNIGAGMGERAASLAGGLVRTGGEVVESLHDTLVSGAQRAQTKMEAQGRGIPDQFKARRPTVMDMTPEQIAAPSPIVEATRSVATSLGNVDLGYEEMTSWEDFKKSPVKSFIPFAIEQGLISAPDMAAAIAALPAYVAARTGELGQDRAQNNDMDNATVEDLIKVLPASVGSALLERFGARGMLGLDEVAVQSLKQVPKAMGKSAVKEGLTEAAQESLEYGATTIGTESGFDPAQMAENAAAGAVAGTGFGGIARGVTATGEVITGVEPQAAADVPIEGREPADEDDPGAAVETGVPPALPAPATQDGAGQAVTPPAQPAPSNVPPEIRALLRRSGVMDDDIDRMSQEEIANDVDEAMKSGVRVNQAMIDNAATYQAAAANPMGIIRERFNSPEEQARRAMNRAENVAGQVRLPIDAIPETSAQAAHRMLGNYKAQRSGMSGTRQQPVKIDAPQDLDVAGGVVNPDPTDGQKSAGNYQKGHIKINGFDVAIENPKDSIRSGISPDGRTWSTKMPAHYGYIKRSEGADGDQLDVYVGPRTDSQRVYVVDQKDPNTGKFDEHKPMMGFGSLTEARNAYRQAFDDGRGAERIGAITPMSMSEFRKWVREGDTKAPLRMGKPAPTNEQGFPIDRQGRIKKPESLTEFLARQGGIQDQRGDLAAIGLNTRKAGFVAGAGPLVRRNGMPLDQARKIALEAGYLTDPGAGDIAPSESTIADLLDALDADSRNSRQTFSQYDEDHAFAWMQEQGSEAREDSQSEYDAVIAEVTAATGMKADDAFAQDIASAMMEGNLSVDEAADRVAIATYEDAGTDFESAIGEIPFFEEAPNEVQPGTAPEARTAGGETGERGEGPGEKGQTQGGRPEGPDRGETRSEVDSQENDGRRDQPRAEVSRPTEVAQATAEPGADNLPQTVIPGAERITRKQQAERQASKPMRASKPQREAGGMFDEANTAPQLFDAPQPTRENAPQDPPAPAAKIDDFGERLEGARKFMAAEMTKALSDETIDVSAEPLSKSFPQPNYVQLAGEGVDPEAMAMVAVMRDMIPIKPRKGWKVGRWADQVKTLRKFANDLLSGDVTTTQFKEKAKGYDPEIRSIVWTAEAITGTDPARLTDAAKWRIKAGSYSMFEGVRYSPSKTIYSVEDANGRRVRQATGMMADAAYDETVEGIIGKARKIIAASLEQKQDAPREKSKYTEVSIYRDRFSKDIYLAFKVRSTVIRLKGGFADVKEARAYRDEHRDELQAKIDEMRRGPDERRSENDPRKGKDWREGDISPETFSDAFGFRGVQFGNYVEGPRRQADLNRAYDALMDLADAVGIPPKALSLDGRLGLAFGARGKGGKGASAAHYERDNIVINLTKNAGPGSLAHEWLHALDNYFGRANKNGSMVSEAKRRGDDIRPEMFDAWKAVERALETGSFAERSKDLDKARSKPYFSTTVEKAARAFERYIVDRLAKEGFANDYLANINLEGGAYPTDQEMADGIKDAYDGLLSTIEFKDGKDGNVILYSATPSPSGWGDIDTSTPIDYLTESEQSEILGIIERVAGTGNVVFPESIEVGPNADGRKAWGKSSDEAMFAAGYFQPNREAANDLIGIALDTGNSKTAYHEAFHRVQRRFLNPQEKAVLEREAPRLRQIIQANDIADYDVSKMSQKELEAEAFALYADQMDRNGAAGMRLHIGIRRAWERIRQTLRRIRQALNGMGYQTVEDIFDRAQRGDMAKRAVPEPQAEPEAQFSLVEDAGRTLAKAIDTQKAAAKIKSSSKIDRDTADDGESLKNLFKRKIIDYLNPVSEWMESLGFEPGDMADPYLQARLAEDRSLAKVKDIYDRYVDPVIDEIGKGDITLEDVHRYLYALHAQERNEVVGKRNPEDSQLFKAVTDTSVVGASGLSTNEAQRILRQYNADPKKSGPIKRSAKMIRQMLDANLQDQKASGLLSAETYNLLTKQWSNYVPLKSAEGIAGDGSWLPPSGKGFDVRGKDVKTALGRFSEADNIILHSVQQTFRSTRRQGTNTVGKAVLRLLNMADPTGEKYAEVYWSDDAPIGGIVKAEGLQRRAMGADGKVKWEKQPFPINAGDTLATKVGGKTYYIRFNDPKIGNAFKKMNDEQLSLTMKLLGTVSNWQSIVNTRKNPAFTPINIIRDAWTGKILLSHFGFTKKEANRVVMDMPAAMGAMWRYTQKKAGKNETQKKWDGVLKEWREAGGQITFDNYATIGDDISALEKQIMRASRDKATPAKMGEVWRNFMEFIENVNDAGENAIRIAAYAMAREKGMTVSRSAFIGRDLTVDFKKRGELSREANALWVFFNSSTQGNWNLLSRGLKTKEIQKAAGKFILSGFILSMINAMAAGDDDDGENAYEKLLREQPYILERNVVFFIPGTADHVKFPLPFGFNAAFNIGVQGHAVSSGSKDILEGILSIVRVTMEAFNPVGSGHIATMIFPTAADPWIEVWLNQNFAGNPIHPTGNPFDRSPPPESSQSFNKTNPAFKAVAEGANAATGGDDVVPGLVDIYPDTLEHLWGFLTGGVGRFLGQTGETIIRGSDGEFEPTKTPFVRSFYGAPTEDGAKARYFNMREKVMVASDRYKDYLESGRAEKAKDILDESGAEIAAFPAFKSADSARRKINKYRRALQGRADTAENRKRLEALDKQEQEIMLRARQAYIKARSEQMK